MVALVCEAHLLIGATFQDGSLSSDFKVCSNKYPQVMCVVRFRMP